MIFLSARCTPGGVPPEVGSEGSQKDDPKGTHNGGAKEAIIHFQKCKGTQNGVDFGKCYCAKLHNSERDVPTGSM